MRKYSCLNCAKKFSRVWNRDRHIRDMHTKVDNQDFNYEPNRNNRLSFYNQSIIRSQRSGNLKNNFLDNRNFQEIEFNQDRSLSDNYEDILFNGYNNEQNCFNESFLYSLFLPQTSL